MKIRITLSFVFLTNILFAQLGEPVTPSFHDTQGKLDITSSGQASFVLPIALPPSIQDVGPTINLVYASGQNGGIAGQGWNISTISAITRISTRIDIDGFVDGVDFDENDKLALDGQRLLLVSGTGDYWAENSEYQTEIQSNYRIVLKGTGSSIHFIVTAPDGSKTWYGQGDSFDNTAFYIKKFQDTNGNVITYNYSGLGLNNVRYLNSIDFSANINGFSTPLNSINFYYKNSKRSEISFNKGIKSIKSKILDRIEVNTNATLFRKYQLTHSFDGQLGYEKVIKLQEFNFAGESANPILFDYNNSITTTSTDATELTTTYNSTINPQAAVISGDFDGDGAVDFYNLGKLYIKLFQNANNLTPSVNVPGNFGIPITTLSNTGKLNQYQSFFSVENLQLNQISFRSKHFNAGTGPNIVTDFIKTIEIPNWGHCWSNCPYETCSGTEQNTTVDGVSTGKYVKASNEYIEGDYNGDGISEILIIGYAEGTTYSYNPNPIGNRLPDPSENCDLTRTHPVYPIVARVLDTNPNSSVELNTKGYVNISNSALFGNRNQKRVVVDFNGDGKTDILVINPDKSYRIVGFKQLNEAPWVVTEILGQGFLPNYEENKIVLAGDYNGDGKSDLMIPEARLSAVWHIYFANPKINDLDFFTKESFSIVEYNPDTGTPGTPGAFNTFQVFKSYYAIDTNKDGKTDLAMFKVDYAKKEWWQYHNFDTKWKVFTYANNIGKQSGSGFVQDYVSETEHNNGNPEIPFLITANFKAHGANREMAVIRKAVGEITYINFTKNVSQDNLLKKVTSNNGNIKDEITYMPMEGITGGVYGSLGNNSPNLPNYPFIEINKIPTSNLVSQLKNTTDNVVKFQRFLYNGFTMNMTGLGVVGFKKTARSSWYNNSSTNLIWNVTISDPLLRGATVLSYSYNNSLTADPFQSFATLASGRLNQTEFEYIVQTTNNVYTLLLDKQITKDFLTDVKVVKKIEYTTDYKLPYKQVTKNYLNNVLQGTTTSITTYDNNTSVSNYFIGKPIEVENKVDAYSDIFETKEKYYYNGYKLIKTEKKGNTTANEYLVEEFVYDNIGNISSKTLSTLGVTPAHANRTTSYTYDNTGRFVKTTTDTEGLVGTNVAYHPIYGMVTESINPFGLTSKSLYDNWGKPITVTDFLNKSVNYTYEKTGNTYMTTQVGDDDSMSIKITDALGRVIKTGVLNIDYSWTFKNIEYDYLGRKFSESEPYSGASPTLWNTTDYDVYSRTISNTAATGLVTSLSYSGLTTTATDGTKTTSSTKNSNGHVVTATDNGGTINYTYFANGNLKTSTFEGTTVAMEYDAFGRKTKLTDPSAGIYTYKYNFYGELIKETTPKGYTDYVYDDFGKLTQKAIKGNTADDLTDITSNYTYNPTTKLVTNLEVINPNDGDSNYSYVYDAQNRLIETNEEYPGFTYQNKVEFDVFGRVEKEYYHAQETNTGKTTSKKIKKTFKNGNVWQIFDDENNQQLYSTNAVNSRGQVSSVTLGNNIIESYNYNAFGIPNIHSANLYTEGPDLTENITNVFSINYNFNSQRVLLNSRTNTLFNTTENFEYDNLDRLIKWEFAPQILHNNTFTDDTNAFTAESSATINAINNVLQVSNVSSETDGTKKVVFENAPVGTKLKISANFEMQTTNKLKVEAVQENLSDGSITTLPLGDVTINGLFEATFVTTQHINNISIQILKSETSTDINVPTTFRIDDFVVTQIKVQTQNYDNKGRITENEMGTYQFASTIKKYQHTSTALTPVGVAHYGSYPQQDISYNAFKAPVVVHEYNRQILAFKYNAFQNRATMTISSPLERRMPTVKHYTYDGAIEIKYDPNTQNVEFITHIGGDGYTAPIIYKTDGVVNKNYLYLHRDYLGSIVAISNQSGMILEKRWFDAWGNINHVQDGAGNNFGNLKLLDRGYTGHEHLQYVKLIHMNGRLYDPKLHRFLQPDNFIQDPYNTQNYNRYGYVFNNPLKYTDPSGEELLTMVAIGVGIGIAAYLLNAIAVEAPITLGGILQTTFFAVISTTATFGVGSATASIGNFFLRTGVQAVAHGTVQGGLSEAQGGKFCSGFYSGAISSLAASAWQGGSTFETTATSSEEFVHQGVSGFLGAKGTVGTLIFGSVSGGLGAELGGGNFWQGAVTGLIVSAFNHDEHKGGEKEYTYKKAIKNGEKTTSEKIIFHKRNSPLFKAAMLESMKDGILSIYAHGNTQNVNHLHELNQIENLFSSTSQMWRDSVENGCMLTIDLKVCNTGNISEGWTISQDITKKYGQMTIWAPANYWTVSPNSSQPTKAFIKNDAGFNMFRGGSVWDHVNMR